MNTIKSFIFGIPARGENVISKQPSFRTYNPNSEIEFNTWSYLLKVGSRVQKNNSINPWYKDRN